MTAADEARAARRGAGWFRLRHRGVIEVSGGDRARWLNGMVSGDVAALDASPGRSGCRALLLTAQGRIVADLQVLHRGDSYWLDLEAGGVDAAIARLSKYVIADDVALADRRADLSRIGVEGPAAPAVLARALGAPPALAPNACADAELGGAPAVIAAFGFGGDPAFQITAPREREEDVIAALRDAGGDELVEGSGEALEILRIEAGEPRLFAELDESVLPAEARLERAVSRDKGCYTGQEVVERLRSQGRPSHLLVGLRAEGERPPAVEAPLLRGDARVGEVTSACVSPRAGAIALGFARRAAAEPGTELAAGDARVRVAALPFDPGPSSR